MNDDAIFWERLQDMPIWEAEQELVLRREGNVLEANMLLMERDKLLAVGMHKRARELMSAHQERLGQNTKINERIKYLRNLQNRLQWKEAVRALFGQDGVEQCVVWIEQQYGHIEDQRREWAK